tara:strand:+ start:89 stop:562 length:474 start_codon:yes stop_codon:yes gene_type:complete
MKKILFVCLGNICRSPAAEGVFLDLISQKNLSHEFEVDSAGTGDWHIGELPDKRMREAASRRGVELTSRARQFKRTDFEKFDLIIVMDNSNFKNVFSMVSKEEHKAKLRKFTEFSSSSEYDIVPDPYFGGNEGFEEVLDLVEVCSLGLLEHCQRRGV